MTVGIAAVCIAGLLMFTFAFMWGRGQGRAAENKAIRDAFENAGAAKDAMDKVLASPLDTPHGLFDDWVSEGDN